MSNRADFVSYISPLLQAEIAQLIKVTALLGQVAIANNKHTIDKIKKKTVSFISARLPVYKLFYGCFYNFYVDFKIPEKLEAVSYRAMSAEALPPSGLLKHLRATMEEDPDIAHYLNLARHALPIWCRSPSLFLFRTIQPRALQSVKALIAREWRMHMRAFRRVIMN